MPGENGPRRRMLGGWSAGAAAQRGGRPALPIASAGVGWRPIKAHRMRLYLNMWVQRCERLCRPRYFRFADLVALVQNLPLQIGARDGVVVDLGCAPGSWLQYASKVVGSSGRLVGIDTKNPEFTGWATWGGDAARTGVYKAKK